MIGLGAGGAAVFITHVEAGPVALLIVGLVFLLIGMGGRMPNRIKAGDYEAAWEAVQEFAVRVADEIPIEARPELLDAVGDLAEAAPSAAARALSAWLYEEQIMSMLRELALTDGKITFDPLSNDRLFDGVVVGLERRVAIEIKARQREVGSETLSAFSGIVAIERNKAAVPITGLLVSRTKLAPAAQNRLGAAPYIYVAVIRGPEDRDKLATALVGALGLEETGSISSDLASRPGPDLGSAWEYREVSGWGEQGASRGATRLPQLRTMQPRS